MKHFGFSINIDKNSNTLVSHAGSNWSALREGSLININNETHFYTIGHKENFNISTNFKNLNGSQIQIDGNYESFFLNNDLINLSYKEYTLSSIMNIVDGGAGYKKGDILIPDGGQLSINSFDNNSETSAIEVKEVDGNGKILKTSITKNGKYLYPPNSTNAVKGGKGKNAQIILQFVGTNYKKNIDRQVIKCVSNESETVLTLNFPISIYIVKGDLFISKWKAYLTSNYVGENVRNGSYHVIRDYTPNHQIPLMTKGTNKIEETYNHSVQQFDKIITNLTNRINELEKNK
jgi:hypothetical protein